MFYLNIHVYTLFILIVICSVLCKINHETNQKQELARVIYHNQKYVQNVTVFTVKTGDRSYVTSVLANVLHPWGNNVSIYFKYNIAKTNNDFEVTLPLCKGLNEKWLKEYLTRFTTQPLSKCPTPAVFYNFSNIEIPPKNFPFPLPKGRYHLKAGFFITQTKEKILDIEAKIYI